MRGMVVIGANVKTVSEALVACITGINLSGPLSNSQADFMRQLWNEFPILYFPKQSLEPTNLRSFGEVFGRPEPEPPMNEIYLQEGEDVISYVGNIHPDGTPYYWGNQRATSWHTDQSYIKTPVSAGILHCLQIPNTGGGTMFCNMYAAFDSLSDDMKDKIKDLRALHCYSSGPGGSAGPPLDPGRHGEWPVVFHPIVRTHPLSGRSALYVNSIHTFDIEGMESGEANTLLNALIDHATADRFVYYHPWEVGDVILWDQRCLMHKSAADYPTDQTRLLMRVKIAGDAPF